jgi:hypothetical protein
MNKRAVALKDPLDVFIQRYSNLPICQSPYRRSSILTYSDWLILLELKAIIKPLKRITKRFEDNKPNFGNVVANLYSLKRDLVTLYAQYLASFNNPGLDFLGPDIAPEPKSELKQSPEPEQRPCCQIRLSHRFQNYEVKLPQQADDPVVVELSDPLPNYVDLDS